jgi:histidine phosphotransferase ChpT
MSSKKLEFSALLCSRLCHDLVSPVSAVANGIEILNEETDQDMREQVMQLLEASAVQTSNRLQFYRMAFGGGGGFGNMIELGEAHRVLSNLLSDSKISLDWELAEFSANKDQVKLIMNLSLVAGEGLIRGGAVKIDLAGSENSIDICITAEGERLIYSDTLLAVLTGATVDENLEPKMAPAYLAHVMAGQLGAAIATEFPQGGPAQFTVTSSN